MLVNLHHGLLVKTAGQEEPTENLLLSLFLSTALA